MNAKLKAILDDKIPGAYYLALRIRRRQFEKQKKKLSTEEIRKLDDEMYFERFGRHVNWEDPKAYTEKMQVEKVLHRFPEKSRLTDKYLVREWVADRIGEEYLVPLCGKGVYDDPDDIDFSVLPDAFVVKTNSGSGDAIIVKDKSTLTPKDIRRIRARMKYQLECCYAWYGYEMHYFDIKPRVVVEQFLVGDEEDLPDYKFLCFGGKPYYCWIDIGRYHDHRRNVYDLEWNLQSWNQNRHYINYEGPVEKPANYEKMIEIAAALAEGFQHVRVDLYNVRGKIYFGEMTFTNASGFAPIIPDEADYELGKLWNLQL